MSPILLILINKNARVIYCATVTVQCIRFRVPYLLYEITSLTHIVHELNFVHHSSFGNNIQRKII